MSVPKIFSAVVILLNAALHCQAIGSADFLDKQLAFNHRFKIARHFEDNVPGYDNHTDRFYQEQLVEDGHERDVADGCYKRSDLTNARVVVAGSRDPQSSGVAHRFVVGQKSLVENGVMTDRWDVKVDSLDQQYFGLYHGTDTYVTNRMRSGLIRWLANGIKDYLSITDRTAPNQDLCEHSEIIISEYTGVIKRIISSLSKKIRTFIEDLIERGKFNGPDQRTILASGSVVVLTNHYITIINMGEGRVLTIDNTGELVDQTKDQFHRKESSFLHGSETIAAPLVKLVARQFKDANGNDRSIDYLILETVPVALSLEDIQVIDGVNMLKNGNKEQDEVYDAATRKLMDSVTDKTNQQDLAQGSKDISLMIIDLSNQVTV